MSARGSGAFARTAITLLAMIVMSAACSTKPRTPTVEEMVDRSLLRQGHGPGTWLDRISVADLAVVLPVVVQGVVGASDGTGMPSARFWVTHDLTGEMSSAEAGRIDTLIGSYLKLGPGTAPIVVGYTSNLNARVLAPFITGGEGIIDTNGVVVFPRRRGAYERYSLRKGAKNVFACLVVARTSAEARRCRIVRLGALGIRTPRQLDTFRRLARDAPVGVLAWLVVARKQKPPAFPERLCTTPTEPIARCASARNIVTEAHLAASIDD